MYNNCMKTFKINNKYSGMQIYKVIKSEFESCKSSSIDKLFRIKDVKVNDTRVDKKYIVNQGDIVSVYATDSILFNIPKSILYIYEDENLLVAYKPKKILSCGNLVAMESSITISFEDLVKKDKDNNKIKICHRLDTNTEGLVIFSKNTLAHEELVKAFKNKTINKEYITLVSGKMEKETEVLENYMEKDIETSYVKITDRKYKLSLPVKTEYKVLKYFPKAQVSLLQIKLHTGRTHQIRAHMKYIGHSVIGDSKYGSNEINRKLGLDSQFLIAYSYSFNFEKENILYYLNNIVIKIDDDNLKIPNWIN